MMEERDFYLQQKIDNVAATFGNMIELFAKSGENQVIGQTLQKVNRELLKTLNLNIDEITNIPLDHFLATITVDDFVDNHNLDLLAELLYQVAKAFAQLSDKETSKRLFSRSLIIYKFLVKVENDFPYERHLRIKELSEILLQ
jgi:hypothetical protein